VRETPDLGSGPGVRASGRGLGAAERGPLDSAAEAGDQLGEVRVRAVAIGQDGQPVGGRRDGRPGDANRGIVPGEAELVGTVELVGHEIDELERLEGEEPVGDPDRDDDPVVLDELARLDDGLRPASVQ